MSPIKSVKKGKLQGTHRTWFDNGQIKLEDPFHKGRSHGLQRKWYKNGQLEREANFVSGAYHGRRREWYANGRQKHECYYTMNRLDGAYTEWYRNGLIKEQGRYLEGEPHGVWKEYNDKGRLINKRAFVRGVALTGRIHQLIKTGKLKAKHILKTQNQAVRRILLEELGYERFLAEVRATLIDREGDYELFKIDWHSQEEPLYLVKVKCPSTGAFYTLRVPPTMKTVGEAVAWTFGLKEEEYQLQEES